MRFRIHFTINGYEDYFEISGDDMEQIKKEVHEYFEKRGTTYKECNAWSEQI